MWSPDHRTPKSPILSQYIVVEELAGSVGGGAGRRPRSRERGGRTVAVKQEDLENEQSANRDLKHPVGGKAYIELGQELAETVLVAGEIEGRRGRRRVQLRHLGSDGTGGLRERSARYRGMRE